MDPCLDVQPWYRNLLAEAYLRESQLTSDGDFYSLAAGDAFFAGFGAGADNSLAQWLGFPSGSET